MMWAWGSDAMDGLADVRKGPLFPRVWHVTLREEILPQVEVRGG